MKTMLLPIAALTLLALAAPAAAACPFSQQTTEKPQEKVENPSA